MGGMKFPISRPGETLVIHCIDPRFAEAFAGRLLELPVNKAVSLTNPGGIFDLVFPSRSQAGENLWEKISFSVRHLKLSQVVIFQHDDCQWEHHWQDRLTTCPFDLVPATTQLIDRLQRELGVNVIHERAILEEGGIRFQSL